MERFDNRVHKVGHRKARQAFVWDVIRLFRPGLIRPISGSQKLNLYDMFTNNFKIAWRGLLKQRTYAAIQIGGLAIGIASCILISLFIKDEVSYDTHYEDGERIFRLANAYTDANDFGRWTLIQAPVRSILYESFPEIEKVSRIVVREWKNAGDNQFRKVESKRNIYEKGFIYADPEILEILEVPMIYGVQKDALKQPNSIVLSRSKAEKYYPNENPVGKQIALNDGETVLTIGGVMDDFPGTSHLQYDFIITLADFEFWPGEQTNWCCSNYEYYLKLKPGTDKMALEKKLLYIRDNFVIPQLEARGATDVEDVKKFRSYYLQPVSNIYLNPDEVGDGLPSHGVLDVVRVLAIIAVIILLLACINFVNLSTAKSANRAKEVGLRKVIGSSRLDLIYQYLSESLLYSFSAILLGAMVSWFVLPWFNALTEKAISFPWMEWWFVSSLLLGVVVVGILSGGYPALYLSAFKPADVLKGKLRLGSRNVPLKNGLVVFQFVTSIVLIIGAMIVHRQMDFFLNKKLGFSKDQVITIESADTMGESRQAFKEALLQQSDVKQVTVSSYLPIAETAVNNYEFWQRGRKELDPGVEARVWSVDADYIETLGMHLVSGKDFLPSSNSDKESIIINQKMADLLNLDQPIGATLVSNFGSPRRVIGVVEDFHFGSLAGPIGPLCMLPGKSGSQVIVKVESEDMEKTMQSITSLWDDFMPNQPIRYSFLDERFANTWTNRMLNRIESIFLVFAGLAISIACLGLFALSAFMVEQRAKEISIRKVLGASIKSILVLVTSGFVKLVFAAMLIAIPIGWYFMRQFLADFAYRIDLSWDVFLTSGLLAVFIAVLTVGHQALKVAFSNPVDSLRDE